MSWEFLKAVKTVAGNSQDSFKTYHCPESGTEKDSCPDRKRNMRLGKRLGRFPETVSFSKNGHTFFENELLFFENGRSNYKNVCPFFRLKHLKEGWSNKRTKSFSRNIHLQGVCGVAEAFEGFFSSNLQCLAAMGELARKWFTLCIRAGRSHSCQAKAVNRGIIHRRGGMLPPECIHKYTFRSVIGRIQCAPTVDESAIYLLAWRLWGKPRPYGDSMMSDTDCFNVRTNIYLDFFPQYVLLLA